jgi:hypothetical protein
MAIIIIGVYDDYSHGYSAKNELLASGFSRGQVQLNPDQEAAPRTGKSVPVTDDGSVSAGIGNFFRSLFGVGDKSTHSNIYAEAVRRGSYVLTVEADDDEQRVRAEEIMHRFLPVDIEERSTDWIRHGWRGHDPSVAIGGGKVRILKEDEPPSGRTG